MIACFPSCLLFAYQILDGLNHFRLEEMQEIHFFLEEKELIGTDFRTRLDTACSLILSSSRLHSKSKSEVIVLELFMID